MELPIDRSIRHWWVFLIRGILFILVGIYMIFSPLASFIALGFLFGLMILLAGISELLNVPRGNSSGGRSWHLALGIIEILFGIVLMSHVATSVAILRILVGISFIFRGVTLFNVSRSMHTSWVPRLGGVLIVMFGLLILFDVAFGSITVILFVAIAFIITGIFNAWLGYNMKPRTS